ncbi:MAG: HEAT repeat domain-containing protein, partial [candidate division KSB1 bacterium]|nr:HEAT repeat domain-containing protein [candidate division KSB1 bacterium]
MILWLVFLSEIVCANEVDRSWTKPHIPLTLRIKHATEWALKKYDGQKAWLIYTTAGMTSYQGHDQGNPNHQIVPPSLEQFIAEDGRHIADPTSQCPVTAQSIESLPGCASTRSIDSNKLVSFGSSRANKFTIILDYSFESGRPMLYQLSYQYLTTPFLKEQRPMIWLGFVEASQSVLWLKKQFHDTKYERLQRQIVDALAQHDSSVELAEFAEHLIAGNYPIEVKEAAISMLQRQPSDQSLRLLIGLILRSEDLRLIKKVIASLCQAKEPRGRAFVRSLARQAASATIRKEAIFWLSQMADTRSVQVLHEIMHSNADVEIKEATVFAISQLPTPKARSLLASIAQFDPSARIRKKARFWLQHTSEQRLPIFLDELIQVEASP